MITHRSSFNVKNRILICLKRATPDANNFFKDQMCSENNFSLNVFLFSIFWQKILLLVMLGGKKVPLLRRREKISQDYHDSLTSELKNFPNVSVLMFAGKTISSQLVKFIEFKLFLIY